MPKSIGSFSFKDNSREVLEKSKHAVNRSLVEIGILARDNTKDIIWNEDIWDSGDLYKYLDYLTEFDQKKVHIGSPQKYAIYPELGTHKFPGKYYLRRGVFSKINRFRKIVKNNLENA